MREEVVEEQENFRREEGRPNNVDLENLEVDQVMEYMDDCFEVTNKSISNNEEGHTEITEIQKDISQTRKEAQSKSRTTISENDKNKK